MALRPRCRNEWPQPSSRHHESSARDDNSLRNISRRSICAEPFVLSAAAAIILAAMVPDHAARSIHRPETSPSSSTGARMTAADYFIATATTTAPCLDLRDAYWQAYRLLRDGVSCVEILQRKHVADCWGEPTGEDGLLHRLAPAEHPIAPAFGTGSTATFPPYIWRWLHESPPPATAPSPPVAPPEPVAAVAIQNALF